MFINLTTGLRPSPRDLRRQRRHPRSLLQQVCRRTEGVDSPVLAGEEERRFAGLGVVTRRI
jgi:hypothetical protein